MSFLRNPQIYPPICSMAKTGDEPLSGFAPGSHRLDESAAGYSLAGCAPAEPASASPGDCEYAVESPCWSRYFHRTANSVLTVCVRLGGKCMTIRAVFDGSVLRPEEPLRLEPNRLYLLTVEEDGGQTPSCEDQSAHPLSVLLSFAADLGVSDLAARHDHYTRSR